MADTPTFAIPSRFLGVGGTAQDAAFVVAGIPLDIGTTNRAGTRYGPAAIRRASRMLVDGAHPAFWTDPATLDLADIGDFAIALGDIPASLARIEPRRRGSTFAVPGRRARDYAAAVAGADAAAWRRVWRWCISTRMSTRGRPISARSSGMVRCSSMRSRRGWSIRGA